MLDVIKLMLNAAKAITKVAQGILLTTVPPQLDYMKEEVYKKVAYDNGL